MAVLRSIESKLESLFEGVFGRAFRTNVQPVELARKLVKEMDEHRNVSVSRVYVPNEYTIFLSPDDRQKFVDYEDSLREELQEYVASHARRERPGARGGQAAPGATMIYEAGAAPPGPVEFVALTFAGRTQELSGPRAV